MAGHVFIAWDSAVPGGQGWKLSKAEAPLGWKDESTFYCPRPVRAPELLLLKLLLNSFLGIPVVAQWLKNPTRNHEVPGSVPGLAQWTKDLALP